MLLDKCHGRLEVLRTRRFFVCSKFQVGAFGTMRVIPHTKSNGLVACAFFVWDLMEVKFLC